MLLRGLEHYKSSRTCVIHWTTTTTNFFSPVGMEWPHSWNSATSCSNWSCFVIVILAGDKGRGETFRSILVSLQSLHLSSAGVPCFLSCSHMDSNVLLCRRDQCEVVVLFNSHTLAHMHVRFAKVLSQLHHKITTCRNTCTSVQQWSINDNSNNKKKSLKSNSFASF